MNLNKEVFKTVPGIGEIIANELLILLPELGTLNRREIASLSPRANDSGQFNGARSIRYGREGIKPALLWQQWPIEIPIQALTHFMSIWFHQEKRK